MRSVFAVYRLVPGGSASARASRMTCAAAFIFGTECHICGSISPCTCLPSTACASKYTCPRCSREDPLKNPYWPPAGTSCRVREGTAMIVRARSCSVTFPPLSARITNRPVYALKAISACPEAKTVVFAPRREATSAGSSPTTTCSVPCACRTPSGALRGVARTSSSYTPASAKAHERCVCACSGSSSDPISPVRTLTPS